MLLGRIIIWSRGGEGDLRGWGLVAGVWSTWIVGGGRWWREVIGWWLLIEGLRVVSRLRVVVLCWWVVLWLVVGIRLGIVDVTAVVVDIIVDGWLWSWPRDLLEWWLTHFTVSTDLLARARRSLIVCHWCWWDRLLWLLLWWLDWLSRLCWFWWYFFGRINFS